MPDPEVAKRELESSNERPPPPRLEVGELRSLLITALEIRGRKQVPEAQILDALSAQGLNVGAQVWWPEDERVATARAQLAATGSFSRVTLRLAPVVGSPDRVKLVVEVEERGSLSLTRLHAGSALWTPFYGGLEVRERNFLGRSLHLGGGFIFGTRPAGDRDVGSQHGYRLSLEAPGIVESQFGLVASAYALFAREPIQIQGSLGDPDPDNYKALVYRRVGGVLGVTIPFTPTLQLGVDYRFEVLHSAETVGVWQASESFERGVDLALDPGASNLASAEFSFMWDARVQDSHVGEGGRFRLDAQLASPVIGSDYEYLKVMLGAAYSFRLTWGHWLTPSVLGGQIAGNAPRFELFHPGDLADWTPGRMLGMLYSTRGPVDVFDTGIDGHGLGTTMTRVDLEYALPLFSRIRTSFFYGGTLFFSSGLYLISGDERHRELRRSLGLQAVPWGLNGNLGVRLKTGIGDLELSVGSFLQRVPL